jgi:hypothetical protein
LEGRGVLSSPNEFSFDGILALDIKGVCVNRKFIFVAIFIKWNPSSRTMVLGSTQPLTEMSTRNLHGGKGRPAHKAGNLTAICEPIV